MYKNYRFKTVYLYMCREWAKPAPRLQKTEKIIKIFVDEFGFVCYNLLLLPQCGLA